MTNINDIIKERQVTHGEFKIQSQISQEFKQVVDRWNGNVKEPIMHEGIDMIVHKLARALAGDPNFIDHWDDISAYSQLVSKYLKGLIAQENYRPILSNQDFIDVLSNADEILVLSNCDLSGVKVDCFNENYFTLKNKCNHDHVFSTELLPSSITHNKNTIFSESLEPLKEYMQFIDDKENK